MDTKNENPQLNASRDRLLDLLDKVVVFERDDEAALAGFDQSDTWIGKIPCSAVKCRGEEEKQDE